MELVSIAALLRRRRIALAIGFLAAVALGVLASGILTSHGSGAAAASGEALVQVELDTRTPEAATTNAGEDATIVQQSVLLAARMQSDTMTAKIARAAGVEPDAVTVLGPTLPPVSEFGLVPDGQLPEVASTAAQTIVTPYVVRLVPNYTVPVITIGTAAPDPRAAVALAQATIAALEGAVLPTAEPMPMPTPTPVSTPSAVPTRHRQVGGHNRSRRRAPGRRPQSRATGRHTSRPVKPVRSPIRTVRRAPAVAATLHSPQAAFDVRSLGPVTTVAVASTPTHPFEGVAVFAGVMLMWCIAVIFAAGFGRLWLGAVAPATDVRR
ncbi:MAG: hypothetical protein ACLP50_00955 [Solirubrobacteraceae bacterium]